MIVKGKPCIVFDVEVLKNIFTVTCKNTEDNTHNIPEFYNPQLYAWWGTIYPEFCFEKGEDTDETKPVKLSFWLAKALDW